MLTDQEIKDIRKSITDPHFKFWDYVKFAREVIRAHEEKKCKIDNQSCISSEDCLAPGSLPL
jgi:hypothetical protein